MLTEWWEDLATGNQLIDSQHKELFRRINLLLAACENQKGRDEVGNLLQFLKTYVKTHFHDEEDLQIRSNYPFFREHREEHDGFIRELMEIEAQFLQEGATLLVIVGAGKMALQWVENHIYQSDKKMSEFITVSTS
jgi:hemerythrin